MGTIAIIVNSRQLDLPVDFVVEKEFETSLFNRELNKRDFTYPSTLPLTDNNNITLGLIDNLAVETKQSEFVADMYVNGVYYNQVTLKILGVSTIEHTIEVSIIGTYGTFARIVGDKKLADLYLDGDRVIGKTASEAILIDNYFFYPDGSLTEKYFDYYLYPSDYLTHVKAVAEGLVDTDYCFYPSTDYRQNLPGINSNCVNFINMWNWAENNFFYPAMEYFRCELLGNAAARHFTVPHFKILYVLKKCFEEFNFVVTGDLFSDPNKQLATLYNTTTINHYRTQTDIPASGYVNDFESDNFTSYVWDDSNLIHPQDHMPDITIAVFINELAKAWNLMYRIDLKQQTVEVVQLKKHNSTAKIIDFSSKSSPRFDVRLDENELKSGYKLAFDFDPANITPSDKIKEDLGGYPVVGTYGSIEILELADPADFNAFDLVYIINENSYYQFGGEDWFFYTFNFLPKLTKEGAENPLEVTTKVVPLPNEMVYVPRTVGVFLPLPLEFKNLYMPISNIGIKGSRLLHLNYPDLFTKAMAEQHPNLVMDRRPIKVQDSEDIKIQPHVTYYRGFRANEGLINMPYASISNIPKYGSEMPGENFYWDAPNNTGLYPTQWYEWVKHLSNSFPVKFDVLITGDADDSIDYESSIFRIHGQHYMLKKQNTPLPYPSVSTMEFVRI